MTKDEFLKELEEIVTDKDSEPIFPQKAYITPKTTLLHAVGCWGTISDENHAILPIILTCSNEDGDWNSGYPEISFMSDQLETSKSEFLYEWLIQIIKNLK